MKALYTIANIKRYKKLYFKKDVYHLTPISVIYSKVVCMDIANLEEKIKAQAEAKEATKL
jgi:hypothetical protein